MSTDNHCDSSTVQQQALEVEAARWISRLGSNQLSAEQQREFSRWLNRSQLHLHTFDRLNAQWQEIGANMRTDSGFSEQLAALESTSTPEPKVNHFNWRWTLAAACSLILLTATLITEPFSKPVSQVYLTNIGEQKTIQLNDGSTLTLNTQSEVSVSYSDSERQLQLIRGEAFFQVAHDHQRPFHVGTNRGRITALGTAFNIDQRKKSVTVIVTEGTVKVEENTNASTLLAANKKVTVNQQITLTIRGLGSVKKTTRSPSWQQQRLEFDGHPLAQVLPELNRYLTEEVQLNSTENSKLEKLPVSGVFNLKDPEQALAAIAASLQLHIKSNDQGLRELALTAP